MTGTATSQVGAYQGFADVTARVSAGGAGAYTTANVQTGRGLDRYAGWSLVVAYHSPSALPRNMTIFDGFETVNSGDPPHEFSVRPGSACHPSARCHQPPPSRATRATARWAATRAP